MMPIHRFVAIAILGFFLVSHAESAQKKKQKGTYTNAAEAGPDFQIQGEYVGEINGKGKIGIQVVAGGGGKFDVYLLRGGLPGAGWDQKFRRKLTAVREGEGAAISGSGTTGKISGGKITGQTDDQIPFSCKKIHRKSPTELAKPPKSAIVLFDGKDPSQWSGGRLVESKFLNWGVRSKKAFGLGTYHVEFRTPFRPKGRGQGRGNSGVYVLGREIQVLDSFGLEGKRNECGAYYGRAKPRVNMCFPPLSWQTFDVVLKANDKGQVLATVKHNGVVIHENLAIGGNAKQTAQINLQNHGNPVYFRNIWHVPVKSNN